MITKKESVNILTESAMMVALSVVLGFFTIPLPFTIYGGGVTFASSIPIAFLSYRRGLKVGVAAAFIVSVIQLLMGLNNLSYGAGSALAVISIIMVDYILPFTVIGFAGMFRSLNRKNTRIGQITTFGLGILTVMVLRFISHLISGSVVWYELSLSWAEQGDLILNYPNQPWLYSFIYNISYMLPETVIALVVGIIIASVICIRSPKFKFENNSDRKD